LALPVSMLYMGDYSVSRRHRHLRRRAAFPLYDSRIGKRYLLRGAELYLDGNQENGNEVGSDYKIIVVDSGEQVTGVNFVSVMATRLVAW